MNGGPLRTVLAEFEAGAESLDAISRRTGLDLELVRLAVERLVAMGRLEAGELSSGCPDGGCGGCASASIEGTPGCGAPSPSAARHGPVLVTLKLRRP